MIKTLQKRFIFSAMLAISILLIVLLGVINVGNILLSERQSRQTANMLLNEELRGQPPREKRPRDFGNPPIDANTKMSAIYFTVQVGANHTIFSVNTERIADISNEDAANLCRQVMEQDRSKGKIQNFLFRAAKNQRDGTLIYLFLDTTAQQHTILRVAFFSLTAGLLCFVAMLLLVILISKKAIRPIAENIERQKQFVTDAGHEIKTPLAIILANAEAMELYQGDNKWLKNIREQTVRLNGLMQNLLALAKADETQTVLRMEKLSFLSEISEALEAFSEPIRLKELKLITKIEPDLSLQADREQIRRLLSVLFDNAVKYSPAKGELLISCQRDGKKINFTVRNQCEKLPDCPPEKLFDRFYRSNAARTQKTGGYGIGLSIAKTIVESHGGAICAAYVPPDQIAFTATFPPYPILERRQPNELSS